MQNKYAKCTQDLTKHFELILENIESILKNPDLYFFKPSCIRMAHSGPGAPGITLGDLCVLWNKGEFICKCPECKKNIFIYSAEGNLGGGISSKRGYCEGCKKTIIIDGSIGESVYWPLARKYFQFRDEGFFRQFWKKFNRVNSTNNTTFEDLRNIL